MRSEDRERIQVEVVSRVVERHAQAARSAPEGYLETLVNDTIYNERRRLEREGRTKARSDMAFYDKILKRMHHASERDLRGLLEDLARRFVGEVVGNFNPRVYGLTTRVVPAGLWVLLNAMSPTRLLSLASLQRGFADQVQLDGEVDHVRSLQDKGTLVVVPTHSSNLDSILMGYGAFLMGIPPLTYGAGLNLFSNPLISFFMHNLGAYKVDRRKTAVLYKDVLKEYATCSMEMGYSNLFFPGGTRSRSGSVERKLKKGLLGTAVSAYTNNLINRKHKPNLYICPCTISYALVLEGSTLIEDHLKEVGKSRYIIEDDESTKARVVYNFLSNLISLDATTSVTFSTPMDVFGNQVDAEGRSLDNRGRLVDPRRYVTSEGEPVHDQQRDVQYTRELADAICKAYLRDNVIHSTNLVAHAMFQMLRRANPALTLYRLLHTGGELASFPMQELQLEVERLLSALRGRSGGPRPGPVLQGNDVQEVVTDALRAFGTYHDRPAAARRGDRVFHEDRNLLLFYSNRLKGYDLREDN
jgi:glycerol-3-phosphate O-acyltransferase